MADVFISVGSNIARNANIRGGIQLLREQYQELIISSVYESESVGFDGDNFFNLVVGFTTDEDVYAVHGKLREIEDTFGRDRTGPRFSSRTLDLDLLLYDDLVMKADGLELPRDEITKNAFVLWPLAEIAPDIKHPALGCTFAELWQAYDKDKQSLWSIPFDWLE